MIKGAGEVSMRSPRACLSAPFLLTSYVCDAEDATIGSLDDMRWGIRDSAGIVGWRSSAAVGARREGTIVLLERSSRRRSRRWSTLAETLTTR